MRLSGARSATAVTVGTALALQATTVVSGSAAARLLGVADRGNLALLWIVALVAAQLGSLGTPSALVYRLANDGGLARADWRALARVGCGEAVLVVVAQAMALVLILHDRTSGVQHAAAVTLLVGPAGVAHLYGLAILQGTGRFTAYNVLRALPLVGYTVLVLGALVAGTASLLTVALLWTVPTALFGAFTLMYALRHRPADTVTDPTGARPMVGFGLRAIFGSFALFEQLQLDQALVAALLATEDLGIYVAAVGLSNLPRFIGTSVGAVAYPAVAGAAATGPTAARRAVLRFSALGAAACALVAAVLAVAVGEIVPLLFGDAFKPAVPVARILLLGSFLQSVRRILTEAARGTGRPGLGTVGELVTLATMLPLAVVLSGGEDGVEGVAWALTAASLVGLLTVGVGLLRPTLRDGRPQ